MRCLLGVQEGRGEFGSGQGSTQGRMKNSLHWFPLGAVRSEAGLGSLCKLRGVLGPGTLQEGQDRPLALQSLPVSASGLERLPGC